MAPPPIPVTTVLINPTAHAGVERGGVISITTMACVASMFRVWDDYRNRNDKRNFWTAANHESAH